MRRGREEEGGGEEGRWREEERKEGGGKRRGGGRTGVYLGQWEKDKGGNSECEETKSF